jgi:hypothetical protein
VLPKQENRPHASYFYDEYSCEIKLFDEEARSFIVMGKSRAGTVPALPPEMPIIVIQISEISFQMDLQPLHFLENTLS